MFFGGSFQCSPISADSCPPDVSACVVTLGSHGLSPKLSPLFRSEKHAKQLSNFNSQVSVTKAFFALSLAKSAHPQNAPATPAESALPFLLDLKPTRINTYEKFRVGRAMSAGAPFVALCATSGSPVCNTTRHSVCKKTTGCAAASLRSETIFGCFSLQYAAVNLCAARPAE
jgi:hypothetical protein